jgi:hypothetical protein
MENFWQWDYFGEYLAFLGLFVLTIATVTILNKLIFGSAWVTETVGGLALMIESTLAMPQFYSNWKSKTTGSLRYLNLSLANMIGLNCWDHGFWEMRSRPFSSSSAARRSNSFFVVSFN